MSLPSQLALYAQLLTPLLPATLDDLAADALYTPRGHPTRRKAKIQQLAAAINATDPSSIRTVSRIIDSLVPYWDLLPAGSTVNQVLVLLAKDHKLQTRERKTTPRPTQVQRRGPRGPYKLKPRLPELTRDLPPVVLPESAKALGFRFTQTPEEAAAEAVRAEAERAMFEAQKGTSMFGT